MTNNRYIDYDLIQKYPNKYNLTPKMISNLRVLEWDKLKKVTWFNEAIYKSSRNKVWCHLEGCNVDGKYNDEDEFWIGFYSDGRIRYSFSCFGGMCSYNFNEFYAVEKIENKYDMGVQVNAVRWLTNLIDQGILEVADDKN